MHASPRDLRSTATVGRARTSANTRANDKGANATDSLSKTHTTSHAPRRNATPTSFFSAWYTRTQSSRQRPGEPLRFVPSAASAAYRCSPTDSRRCS